MEQEHIILPGMVTTTLATLEMPQNLTSFSLLSERDFTSGSSTATFMTQVLERAGMSANLLRSRVETILASSVCS